MTDPATSLGMVKIEASCIDDWFWNFGQSKIFSIVTINQTVSEFNAYQTVKVLVTPYDYDGTLKTSAWGSYIFEYEKFDTAGNSYGKSNITMTDNADGTYSLTFTSNLIGSLTYSVYLIQACTFWTYFYNSVDLSGSIETIYSYDSLYDSWGSAALYPGGGDIGSAKFIGKVTAPETNTYTISISYDDYVRFYIDGALQFDHWAGLGVFSGSFTYNFIAGQQYDIIVDFADGGGGAKMQITWAYGSISGVKIYGDALVNVFLPEIVSGTSYTLTVLEPVWGDGIKYDIEDCDDGNTISKDGWSASCKIENLYIWTSLSNSQSKCSHCGVGLKPDASKTKCIDETSLFLNILVIAIIGTSLNLSNAFIANTSLSGTFGFANFIQMIFLLPLLAKYMPFDVVKYIYGLSVWLLNLSFIYDKGGLFANWIDLHYEQTNSYLGLIGLDSGSTTINAQATIFLWLVVLIFIGLFSWANSALNGKVIKSEQVTILSIKSYFYYFCNHIWIYWQTL